MSAYYWPKTLKNKNRMQGETPSKIRQITKICQSQDAIQVVACETWSSSKNGKKGRINPKKRQLHKATCLVRLKVKLQYQWNISYGIICITSTIWIYFKWATGKAGGN